VSSPRDKEAAFARSEAWAIDMESHHVARAAAAHGLPFIAPPLWLCTDNAAMIAWAGALRFEAGLVDGLDAPARARWPLDPDAEKARGAGVKA
jgi:N6-L-threonylcarbamoyladenine synthase